MELLTARRRVIGRYSLDADVIGILHLVAISHDQPVLEMSEHSLVHVYGCGRCAYLVDGFAIEVILVFVGDEDDVCLGEGGIVSLWFQPHANGVHLNFHTVVVDFHTGVLDARDGYFLSAFGGKLVHLLSGTTPKRCQTGKCDTANDLFHDLYDR